MIQTGGYSDPWGDGLASRSRARTHQRDEGLHGAGAPCSHANKVETEQHLCCAIATSHVPMHTPALAFSSCTLLLNSASSFAPMHFRSSEDFRIGSASDACTLRRRRLPGNLDDMIHINNHTAYSLSARLRKNKKLQLTMQAGKQNAQKCHDSPSVERPCLPPCAVNNDEIAYARETRGAAILDSLARNLLRSNALSCRYEL